ncbi:MAG: hypothetical protein QXI84_09100 [Thermofilaceae archaeon]
MGLKGRALSPVVATVILTSIMLTTVAVAVYFSTSLIDAHRQRMEYESAKELLSYAATAFEQVALGTGGARYVRFSLTSTSLSFEQTPYQLQLQIGGAGSLTLPLRRVSVCAGPLVTTVDNVLYPEGGRLDELEKLLVGAGEPIVLVYESFSGRACAHLEARRVRVIYSGVTYVVEDGQQVLYNFYTIHLVNATFGRLGGAGTIPLVFRNKGVVVYEYKLGTPSIQVTASLDGISSTTTLSGASNARGSIVVVKVSQVEIATG